jgi:hypothetical protein
MTRADYQRRWRQKLRDKFDAEHVDERIAELQAELRRLRKLKRAVEEAAGSAQRARSRRSVGKQPRKGSHA